MNTNVQAVFWKETDRSLVESVIELSTVNHTRLNTQVRRGILSMAVGSAGAILTALLLAWGPSLSLPATNFVVLVLVASALLLLVAAITTLGPMFSWFLLTRAQQARMSTEIADMQDVLHGVSSILSDVLKAPEADRLKVIAKNEHEIRSILDNEHMVAT